MKPTRLVLLRWTAILSLLALAVLLVPAGLAIAMPGGAPASFRALLPIVRRSYPRPTATLTPTRTATPTRTLTPTRTATLTRTPTRTPAPSWVTLTIANDLTCELHLKVSGPASYEWDVARGSELTTLVLAGTYHWEAETSCCGNGSGSKTFSTANTWRFYCGPASPPMVQAR